MLGSICVLPEKRLKNNADLIKKLANTYLVSDVDEQGKNDDYEQIVNYADGSDDNVDDLKCKVTCVVRILFRVIIFGRVRRDVIFDITK